MTKPTRRAPSLGEELARRGRLRDALLLLAIPAVPVVVWAAGEPLDSALLLSPDRPTAWQAVTTHLVHASTAHLLGNLAVCLGAVVVGYPLAVLGGNRRGYLILVLGVLVAIPGVISGVHLAVGGSGTLVGFSAVALALVGLLPWVLFDYLRARVHGAVGAGDALGGVLVGAAAVGWPVTGTAPAGRLLVLGVGAVGLLALVPLARRLRGRPTSPGAGGRAALAAAAVGLVFAVVALGASVTGATGVLHLLAYGLAAVGAYGTTQWRRLRSRASPPAAVE